MKSSVPIPQSQVETCVCVCVRVGARGAAVLGALFQPRRWLSNWLQSQCWEPLYHLQDPLFIGGLMLPFKQSPLHLTQSSTCTHTHIHTLPSKICCISVSSSGVISLCQACVVWSDSHALCRRVEGWMEAQSTIALINTNSYARCSQVSISSQCSFSLGVIAHFWQLGISLVLFSLLVRKRERISAQTARERRKKQKDHART